MIHPKQVDHLGGRRTIHPKQAVFYGYPTDNLWNTNYPFIIHFLSIVSFFRREVFHPPNQIIHSSGWVFHHPTQIIHRSGWVFHPPNQIIHGGRKVFHPLTPGPPGARPGDGHGGGVEGVGGCTGTVGGGRGARGVYGHGGGVYGHGGGCTGTVGGWGGGRGAPGVRRGWTGTVGGCHAAWQGSRLVGHGRGCGGEWCQWGEDEECVLPPWGLLGTMQRGSEGSRATTAKPRPLSPPQYQSPLTWHKR